MAGLRSPQNSSEGLEWMAAKPLVIPELFSGEGNQRWDDWLDHFERVAKVNSWDDAAKLTWLPARLTGRAAAVFRRLPDGTQGDLSRAKRALEDRFEPPS